MAVIATVTQRPLARRVAAVPPARSICDNSQPPKMSPCGLASAGMAMARKAGSARGGLPDGSEAGIGNPTSASDTRISPAREKLVLAGLDAARSIFLAKTYLPRR